jgi:exopolysaccharide production protein ExoZ
MNQSIQVARAIAVLLVVVMHAMNVAAAGLAHPLVESAAVALRNIGHFGVDIFFVVSGYIIATVVRRERSAARFLARRAARIYPLFWITLLVLLLIPPFPWAVSAIELSKLPEVLALASPHPAHPVAWTLVYEMHFYLIAAVCVLFAPFATRALLIWCFIQIGLVAATSSGVLYSYQFLTPLSLEFCLGVFLAFAPKNVPLPKPLLWGIGALSLALLSGYYFGEERIAFDLSIRLVFWGFPAAVVVLSAIVYEGVRVRSHHVPASIGDASYSLYMWHIPVLAIVSWLVGRQVQSIGNFAMYLTITVIGCAIVSWLSWRYFEQPINNFFKSARSPRAGATSASASIASSSAKVAESSA